MAVPSSGVPAGTLAAGKGSEFPCGAGAALMLADARLPAGGHAHSGGLEAAVIAGTVCDLPTVEAFLRGRLATAGVAAAGLAAAACARARDDPPPWTWLDQEAGARTPSLAQREASRRQGRALLRCALATWPAPWLADLRRSAEAPHHPIALGAAAAAAGSDPSSAALIAAYLSVSGPASAAVRLLALDPLRVSGMLAALAGPLEAAATRAATAASAVASAGAARTGAASMAMSAELPFPSGPALDLLAEAHARAEVRLFAS